MFPGPDVHASGSFFFGRRTKSPLAGIEACKGAV